VRVEKSIGIGAELFDQFVISKEEDKREKRERRTVQDCPPSYGE